MKRILFIVIILTTFLSWSHNEPNREIKADAKFIKNTAEQLDYLHQYNTNKSGFDKDWYVVILGKDKEEISNYLNNFSLEHINASSKHHNFNEETLKRINNELIEINKHEKYAAYAFITDNEKEIVIPTVPIEERKIGIFLTKLEGKLITASFQTLQEVESYFEQRDLFKSIEEKINKSQRRTDSDIKELINSIYEKAIDFKNSSKQYKLLSYSVLTFLNFKDQEEDNNKRYYVKVYGTQHRHAPGNSPNIDRTVISSYIKGSSLDFSEPENRMFARVDAYRKYIDGENLNVEGLKDGIGKRVYVNQRRLISDSESQKKLLELSNFLTDAYKKQTVTEKYEVIVDYTSIESNKDRKDLLTVIAENDIVTKEGFLKLYPYHGIARQYKDGYNAFRAYFSNAHLWTKEGNISSNETIVENYNSKSADYVVSKGKTIPHPYFYSLSDLIVRYKCLVDQSSTASVAREILRLESIGEAHSVAKGEFYDQYVAMFGTNDAYPFISYCASLWAKDILTAYFAYRLVFQYGAFLMEEVARNIGNEAFRQVIKKYGKDALQGALIDYGVQVAFNYILDDKITTFKQAASPSKINWVSVAWSATENTIKYKKRLTEWGVSGAGACLVNGLSEAGGFKDDFDYQGCLFGLGITYGMKAIFKAGSSPYLRKQAIEAFKKGKDKFRDLLINRGKATQAQADEFVESVEKAINDLGDDLPTGGGGVTSGSWKSVLGKNIDDLTEAPEGYSFYYRNGKKLIKKGAGSTKPTLSAKDGIIRYGAGFKALIRDEFGVVFSKFDGWEKKLQEQFIKDFDNEIDMLTNLNKNTDLIDGWKNFRGKYIDEILCKN